MPRPAPPDTAAERLAECTAYTSQHTSVYSSLHSQDMASMPVTASDRRLRQESIERGERGAALGLTAAAAAPRCRERP